MVKVPPHLALSVQGGGGGNRTRDVCQQDRLVQVAWAAGLFEGEGTIGYQEQNGRIRVRFALATTDLDVLEHFREAVGCGYINGPKWRELSTKPIWLWAATSRADAALLSDLLYPFLGDRRRSALERAWHEFANQPEPRHWRAELTHCKRGHAFAVTNTRIETTGSRRCRTCERARGRGRVR